MDDSIIPYRINKIKAILDSNKKTIISVYDKYFIAYTLKVMKKIIENICKEKNYFQYTNHLTDILSDINSEIKNKHICEKKRSVLENLKKNLKKLFIALSIKHSSE